jgi:hypothetical protein
MAWGITSESLKIQSRPKPRLRLSHQQGSPLPFVIGRVIHDEGVPLADLEELTPF